MSQCSAHQGINIVILHYYYALIYLLRCMAWRICWPHPHEYLIYNTLEPPSTLLKLRCHSDTHGVLVHLFTNDTPKGVSGCHGNLWSLSLKLNLQKNSMSCLWLECVSGCQNLPNNTKITFKSHNLNWNPKGVIYKRVYWHPCFNSEIILATDLV